MDRKCFVSVSIRGLDPGVVSREVVLGEFHDLWRDGVTIGSDSSCSVVLPGLAPVEVLIFGVSNHKLLYRLPEGDFPFPPFGSQGNYDKRVDYREFQVGTYMIRFGEVHREE